MRSHAAELGVKPDAIGIWGFSAGGHLAGYMATRAPAQGDANAKDPIDRGSDRPDFAILSRTAVLALDVYTRAGTTPLKMLIGEHPTQAQIDAVDPLKHVSADTSLDAHLLDRPGPDRRLAECGRVLPGAEANGRSACELHIFELGVHGTHMGDDAKDPAELHENPQLIADWMQLHGWMPATAQ